MKLIQWILSKLLPMRKRENIELSNNFVIYKMYEMQDEAAWRQGGDSYNHGVN